MLRERIETALREARAKGDRRTAATLRLVLAALDEREEADREQGGTGELGDREIQDLLRAMIDQRRSDIGRCEAEARLEDAAREAEEIAVLERFLPPPMDEDQLRRAVEEAIRETGAASIRDAGRVMALLKERYDTRLDPLRAKKLVCGLLRRDSGAAGGP